MRELLTMPATVSQNELLELREAIISAGLSESRQALLATIASDFVAGLPVVKRPGEQILSDLDVLSTTGKLTDGSIPIVIWLKNALALAEPRKESEVFRRVLNEVLHRRTCPEEHSGALHTAPVAINDSPNDGKPNAKNGGHPPPQDVRIANHVAKGMIAVVLWGWIAYGYWKDDIRLWRCENGSDAICMEIARSGWKNYATSGQAALAARALERLCAKNNACSCADLGFVYSNRGLLPDAPLPCNYFQKAISLNPKVFMQCPEEDWRNEIFLEACSRKR